MASTIQPTEAPLREVADLTDTELLDAMDAFGQLYGGDPEEGPEGTEWRIEGYATGSLREAIRQHLEVARREAALMPQPSTTSIPRTDIAVPDDEMPF